MPQMNQTLGLVAYVVRRYPKRTLLLVFLLFLSGLAEGIGVVALLPLLEMAANGGAGESRTAISLAVENAVARVGLPVSIELMLGIIILAMCLKGGFRLMAMRQVGYTVSRVGTDLRISLLENLLRTRWGYFVNQPTGRFASAIGSEASRASSAYRSVCLLFAALVQVAMYTVVAVVIAWQLAVLALVSGAIVAVVLGPLVRRARTASRAQHRLIKSLSIRLTDALQGIKPIKAMGREGHLQPLLIGETRELNRSQEKQVWATEAVAAIQEPLLVVLMTFVLYYSLVTAEQSLATILVIVFLFTRLAGRLGQVQLAYQAITLGEAAFWSLREAIESAGRKRERRSRGAEPPLLQSGITLEDVRFGYGDTLVLDNVNLFIPAGKIVALVGASGGGKTTIADLIVGLHTPRQGRILVDGQPLETLNMERWRQEIGYVPQEMFLFHDTVRQNLTLGDREITDDAVFEALDAAGAREFVDCLPEGLDTVMGERGSRLSGGQRQRIAIARALVRRPRLLVLDEVTTALDPKTEAAICETLVGLRGRVTILSISHQPAMREVADIAYAVHQGRATLLDQPLAAATA
jgi:ATP-binding cassette, subfamily C, bacterial